MLEEWNTRLFASNINKQQQQRQPTNEGGVKYTFVWFQEQQQQIATINSKKLWEWNTLLSASNINKPYTQKTCDVAEKAILAKKKFAEKVRKSQQNVNRDKSA